ncbi:Clathrin light chain [Elasticomyces elasticus]|nr:Clathrin light chain [Elasticomyces elasticus]
MAERFPSLDEFDTGATEARGPALTSSDADPDADFLARERALLGDDANLFASSTDNAATVEDGDDDLLGGGYTDGGAHGSSGNMGGFEDDMGGFESSFPSLQSGNEAVAPGGTITGVSPGAPYLPTVTSNHGYTGYNDEGEEEPQVLREWRERRDQAIRQRDEASANRKAETVKAAQQAIDDFYENYNSKKEKMIGQTHREAEEFLKSREDTTAGGTSWERIAKLVDLTGKGSGGNEGKKKMREMLISLRKDENAPGASGV